MRDEAPVGPEEGLFRGLDPLKKAVAVDEKHADSWYLLGYIYRDMGKKSDALNAFKKFKASAPDDHPDIRDATERQSELLQRVLQQKSQIKGWESLLDRLDAEFDSKSGKRLEVQADDAHMNRHTRTAL